VATGSFEDRIQRLGGLSQPQLFQTESGLFQLDHVPTSISRSYTSSDRTSTSCTGIRMPCGLGYVYPWAVLRFAYWCSHITSVRDRCCFLCRAMSSCSRWISMKPLMSRTFTSRPLYSPRHP